jgi:hypothetical protein
MIIYALNVLLPNYSSILPIGTESFFDMAISSNYLLKKTSCIRFISAPLERQNWIIFMFSSFTALYNSVIPYINWSIGFFLKNSLNS